MRLLLNTLFIFCCCTSCTPHLELPNVDIPSQYLYGEFASNDTIGPYWWHIYNDEVLDSLEHRAIRHNREVAIALRRVESARYSLSLARSTFLPSLDATLSAQGAYETSEGTNYEFILQPTVSWNVSLFGTLKYTNRTAQAELLSTVWAYRGAMLSLTKEVATAYFTILQCSRSLQIARQSHQLRLESAALIDSMVRYGSSTMLELDQANSLVYTAAADVEQYSRALSQARLSLDTLLGETPSAENDNVIYGDLTLQELPEEVPSGIPADMLKRRPDVMESYYDLQAAAARVGVAHSNRFPTIALTGNGGVFGSTVKELFADGHWKWGAMGNIAQPIFNFGKLRYKEEMAIVAYNESLASYEQSVLTALEEVESALVAISTYRSQAERYAKYVIANGRIAQLTEALYSIGMYDYLDVISTQQTWYDSQLELVAIVAQQYINYANLVMALGDGWQGLDSYEK